MFSLRRDRNRIRRNWTAADFDSLEVLLSAGVDRPMERINNARPPLRPLRSTRRAVRAALRGFRAAPTRHGVSV